MRRLAIPAVAVSTTALVAGLLVPVTVAAAPLPASPPAASVPATAPTTPSPRMDVVGLATAAVKAANDIYKCEPFAKDGLVCERKPTIRDVVNRLNQIEQQMAANQKQTIQALDVLQSAIDSQELTKAVKDLSPVTAHIGEAGKAWDALSICTDKAAIANATCNGYAGVKLVDVPVAEGIAESKEFFLGQMDKISLTLEQATQYFAGVEGQPAVGLVHNLWKVAKRQQDRDSGVEFPGQLPLQPVIVTHQLARQFLPVLTYYRDLVYVYGALRPAAQALKGKARVANSEAALADKNIFTDGGRWTVAGSFAYHRIPDVAKGTFAYVGGDGKLYKIVPGEGRGIPLNAPVVMEIGDRLAASKYVVSTMARNASLMPHGGRFGVWEKVKHRTFKDYGLGKYAICAGVGWAGCVGDTAYFGTRTATFEIGHAGEVGTKDKYGNLMKMRWVPMQMLNVPATWGRLIKGELDIGGTCLGELRGEPPSGVWDVQFLPTFRRTVANRHAMFEWDWVGYGDRFRKCVGPGVYVSQSRGAPFSIVDRGTPAGILVTPAASGSKPDAQRYATCQALRADYRAGVAKPGAVNVVVIDGKRVTRPALGKPFVSKAAYRANRHLDRDRDGLACEREPQVR